MARERIAALEYIRGVAMLGVVGIHVGSQYLTNPTPNVHLVALLEVGTRFAVPIFFFVSAFGLFWHRDLEAAVDWRGFYARRVRGVLVPYLGWSLLYMAHYTLFTGDTMLLNLRLVAYYLAFGYGCYHLYFMVILLWFYLLMPLWVRLVRGLRLWHFAPLLLAQVAFNEWSSGLGGVRVGNACAQILIDARLNYWVWHYLLVWLLGAYLGSRDEWWRAVMRRRRGTLYVGWAASLALLLAYFYRLVCVDGYRPEWAINVAQQLSPPGVLYTVGASLGLFALFEGRSSAILAMLGRHSCFVYLAHPLAITYLNVLVARSGRVMTAPLTLAYYVAVVGLTLMASLLWSRMRR